MDPLCVVVGDAHLSNLIWTKLRQVNGDAFYGFTQVTEFVLSKKLPLILAGDLFDTVDPDSSEVKFFREQIDLFQKENIPVYAFQGNHDNRMVPWYSAIHGWLKHVGDGIPFKIGNVTCAAWDYMLKEQLEERLAHLDPSVELLFLHQAAKQIILFDRAWNVDLSCLPSSIRMVVLGDIHLPVDIPGLPFKALYTGATHARNSAQFEPKSFPVIYDDLQSYTRIPLKTRQVFMKSIVSIGLLEELQKFLESPNDTPLPKLIKIDAHMDFITVIEDLERRYTDSLFFINPLSVYRLDGIGTDAESAPSVSVSDLVNKFVKPDNSRLRDMILSIVNSQQAVDDIIATYKGLFNVSD